MRRPSSRFEVIYTLFGLTWLIVYRQGKEEL